MNNIMVVKKSNRITLFSQGDCNDVKNLKHCVYNPNCELRGQDSLGRDCSTYLNDKQGWPKWCECHRVRSKNYSK